MTNQSECDDVMAVSLADRLAVAALEGELIALPKACVVDAEAAATVYFLAQCGMTATEAGLYMQSIEGRRAD